MNKFFFFFFFNGYHERDPVKKRLSKISWQFLEALLLRKAGQTPILTGSSSAKEGWTSPMLTGSSSAEEGWTDINAFWKLLC